MVYHKTTTPTAKKIAENHHDVSGRSDRSIFSAAESNGF